MEEKRCFQCKEIKLLSLFYKNKSNSDGYSGLCKECQSLNEKENNQKAREWIDSIKKENPCSKCGEKRWYVLDFHHIDESKKTMVISTYAISGTTSFETKKRKILEELKNCIILCSNCHREEHYFRRLKLKDF